MSNEICLFVPRPSMKLVGKYDAHDIYVLRKGIDSITQLAERFLKIINQITNETQYKQVQEIHKFLPQEFKNTFIQKAYEMADEEYKYQFWTDGYVQEVNLEYLAQKMLEMTNFYYYDNFYYYYSPYYKIFRKLSIEKAIQLGMFFLEQLQAVSNETQYKQVQEIHKFLSQEAKNIFIQKAYEMADEKFKDLIFINYPLNNHNILDRWLAAASFLLLKPKKNRYYGVPLISLVEKDSTYIKNNLEVFDNNTLLLFALCNKNPFSLLPGSKYYEIRNFVSEGLKTLNFEEILSNKDLPEATKIQIVACISELSNYLESPFGKDFLKNYANLFINNIINRIDYYLQSQQEEELIELLSNIDRINKQICTDFLNKYAIHLSTFVKMKLWIKNVYEVFDYNNYGFYYFRLDKHEKKHYNQKARSLMKDEIKKIMTAQRVPWEYEYTDEQGVNHYAASWKSIWFLNGEVKFCTKVIDDEHIFSDSYRWEYAEEDFNFLFGYLSRKRIEEVKIQEKDGFFLKVEGLDILEEHIYKAKIDKYVAEKGIEGVSKNEVLNKIPPSLIIKNQCVHHLNALQDMDKNPTRLLEINQFHVSGDVSLLFTITRGKNVFIVWESLEFNKSKATHIFKMGIEEYEHCFKEIANFLEKNLKVRSKLNSDDFEEKERLRYLGRIDHDNFDFRKWEVQLSNILNN